MRNDKLFSGVLALVCAAALLTGCGAQPTASAETVSAVPTAVSLEAPQMETQASSGEAEAEEGVIAVTLPGAGEVYTVTEAGTYLLSGSAAQILVDAPEDAKVKLILNGVTVETTDGAAIYAIEADKLVLSSAAGSVNVLRSTADFEADTDSNVDAAVFATCDLTLNGEGTINVFCETGHGVVSKDDLKIKGGTVNIDAAKKGVEGKDSVTIEDGALSILAEGKGLYSDNEEDGKGTILISGGTVYIESADDAIHAVNTVTVEGGSLALSTGDDGIHADDTLTISGGEVSVTRSYEGLEANDIFITGGEISIVASDDGINAAGGNDGSNSFGMFGGDPFGADSGSTLSISGGVLVVEAGGDGLDANGELLVSGGTIYVSGPTNDGNGALDYGTAASITGGTLIAVGSSGMAENFGSGSTQGSILLNTGSQAAGNTVTISDSSGKVLASYSPTKSYSSVLISTADLIQGGTYTVTAGSFSQTLTLDSLIYGSGMGMGSMGGPGMGGMGGPGGQSGWGGQGGPGMGGHGRP